MIDLEPGDFISIPLGTAFTSISHGDEECTYLVVLTRFPAEMKKDASKSAKEVSFQAVEALRNS
jgi:mannose-6-phosphate isomerase-like protein (cupin superfamily)